MSTRAPRPGFPRPDYRALELYAPDRRPVTVDLSDNTNRWGAHPGALAAVRGAAAERLVRYPALYADVLREAAAARFDVSPEQVTTGAGSDDILDSLWRAAREFGGAVRYPAPTFSMIEPFCRMNGREARPLPWADAVEDPTRLLEGDPCLVYICRPNNPTGSSVERSWIDTLLAAADARADGGPLVVFDEAYADYADDATDATLIPLATRRPRTLVIRTLSKAYALAGVRVGLGFGTVGTVLEAEKSRGPYKVNQLAEVAAIAALRDEEGWVARTVEAAVGNRKRFETELRGRGFAPLPSQANFLFIPVAAGTARDLSDAFREHDVALRPFAAGLGAPDGLRVSIGPWDEMARFLEVLDLLGDAVQPAESSR
ncbi:MAG: aminotransferase class I/II-fold pyridoxal phosphate-dependent enzyme [Longimicrobiales bacterium]|nr:aminotransferase class I/II-fold pyridoxal phosphate-dependent enzyme [Longimicrobiales bacterium]